jgi:hypothetical protein
MERWNREADAREEIAQVSEGIEAESLRSRNRAISPEDALGSTLWASRESAVANPETHQAALTAQRFPREYNRPHLQVSGKRPGRIWIAGIVAAIFTISMSYACVCSAMCAAGVCPNELQHSSEPDGCNQMLIGHSHSVQNHACGDGDCSTHHHPNTNIVRADYQPRLRLAGARHNRANNLTSQVGQIFPFNGISVSLSGLAPPPTLRTPVHSRVSVLRI